MKITIDSLFNKLSNALVTNLPFVVYRHPNSKEINGVFQQNRKSYTTVNYSESGFVFAPFDTLKDTVLFPLTVSELYTSAISEFSASESYQSISMHKASDTLQKKHMHLVQKGIDFLNNTKAQKVVLSRIQLIENSKFKALDSYKRLLKSYPNAMVYFWYHPNIGLWLGASPEQLLKVDHNTFTTMALAGTQVYKDTIDVIWQKKEIQEQQFVTDYIIDVLKQELTISKTKTIRAGNVLHLCTLISGTLNQNFSLEKLIAKLHPTPAVCGLPKEETKKFILKNENYNRGYYTGFLGELNVNGTSNLFVNLRCMQAIKDQIAIYIGGGITNDSDPLLEWEETVAKSMVMINGL